MLTALKPGVLTIGSKARARYAVGSGYLRVDPAGAVEILVEQARAGDGHRRRGGEDASCKAAEAELAQVGRQGAGRRLHEPRRSAAAGRAPASTPSRISVTIRMCGSWWRLYGWRLGVVGSGSTR